MKRGLLTSLCIAVLFTACTKQDQLQEIPLEQSNSAFISNWETSPSMNWFPSTTADGLQLYTFKRVTPQLNPDVLNHGTVIVFARGYDFGVMSDSRPMGMPFMFYLPNERMMYPYLWEYDKSNGEIQVALKMHPTLEHGFLQGINKVQLRYFVVPHQVLTQNKITAATLHNLTYAQLVEFFQVAP